MAYLDPEMLMNKFITRYPLIKFGIKNGKSIKIVSQIGTNVFFCLLNVDSLDSNGENSLFLRQLSVEYNDVSNNSIIAGYLDKRDGTTFYAVAHTPADDHDKLFSWIVDDKTLNAHIKKG